MEKKAYVSPYIEVFPLSPLPILQIAQSLVVESGLSDEVEIITPGTDAEDEFYDN